MSLRPERIADYLKKEISNIILHKVRDPRLKSIVINHISVTPVSYTHLRAHETG